MTDAHKLPAAIQWHEGMLLAPQHFQQLSLRQEELLHYHLATTVPFHWGIKKLKVDETLLIDGTLRILELEAVMPDGLVVSHHSEDEENLETDLTPYAEKMKQKPLTVHLSVPVKKIGIAHTKGTLPRFHSAEGDAVPDENTGDQGPPIPRLKPILSLLITEKDSEIPSQKYTTFPLLKIIYKNEIFISLTDFITPALTVPLNSPVGEICSSVARRLREKSVFLSEKINASASMVQGASILETKLLIRSLVSALPHFEAVLNTGKSHPYPLYLSLCMLVGSLASLGTSLIPPVLPKYDHNDLRATYEPAKEFIFRMIDEGILESHTAISFDVEKGVFSLKLKHEWIHEDELVIGVRGGPGIAENDLVNWIEESLIGSVVKIEEMKSTRVLGAERNKIERDGELVPVKGVILFSVKKTNADKERTFIEPDEILQIFNPSDFREERAPSEIILYVRNKS
ncbi:type VI secretion system baseplate subunit TssK [Desulfonema magnum]|uniref:Type IV secretion system protein, VasE-like n=1 Tax=Desulfonema magnum TaxID=45655 RepID=A0A975GLH3_9BACT|nr:type VI secretion system baseplate subunit TssK [Desulfonema magnum]QTA85767.1 Type IV secretion system protein, VasE-like [Desulfonema magnum]